MTAAVLFATAGVLYRKAVSGSSLHPLLASGLRAGPAFLIVLPAFLATGGTFSKPIEYYAIAAASAFFAFFVGDSFFIYGLARAPVGLVYPVAYTFPVFVAVFNFLLTGRTPSPILLVAAGLMVAGIRLVYGGHNSFSLNGLIAGLMASVSWGLGISLATVALRYATPIELNLFRTGLLLVATLPALAKNSESLKRINFKWLLLGSMLGIGLGPLALFTAISLSDAVGPSVISSGAPVFAVVLAVPILKEKAETRILLGATLVALATAISTVWG